jgi:hypothetical protein
LAMNLPHQLFPIEYNHNTCSIARASTQIATK